MSILNKPTKRTPSLPSKADILAFIRERPGKVGTREIARAFGLKNAMRAELKRLLRDLADEGAIEKRRKKLHHPGALPSTVLADVTARDADGDLIATPDEWDEEAHGPRAENPHPHPAQAASRRSRRARRPRAAAAWRRPTKTTASAIAAASSRSSTTPSTACWASSAKRPHGGGRLEPVDKKMLGKELAIPARRHPGAQDGDLVAVETSPRAALGPAHRPRGRAARLAHERARRQPDRHPRPWHPARVPPRHAGRSGSRPAARRFTHREDWRRVPFVTIDPPDAKDHDDAVHAEPDTAANNHGGFIVSVAIADVAHYVTPGSALDREALVRGNSVYFPDRVVPMLPERISNDLCSLRPREDRAALAVRMVIGADGRKRSHTLPSRADALGRQALLPAGAIRDRRAHRRGHRGAGRAGAHAAVRGL